MKSLFKSRITALAVGTIGVVMTSFVVASATITVRDHHDSAGATVRDGAGNRKPVDCLGSPCNVKTACTRRIPV